MSFNKEITVWICDCCEAILPECELTEDWGRKHECIHCFEGVMKKRENVILGPIINNPNGKKNV